MVVKKWLRAYIRKYFELRSEKGGLSSQPSVQAPPEAPSQSEPAGSAGLTPAPPADPSARNVKQVAG